MKVIIDHFEGEFAVIELEDSTFIEAPKVLFPNAHEWDVVNIIVDENETKQRKDNINNLMNDLFK